MRFRRFHAVAMVLFAFSCFALGFALQSRADKVRPIPVEVPRESKPQQIKTYMKMKELGAQRIFSGLIHRDFAEIKKGAESLKWISLDSPDQKSGTDVENKIYRHFRTDFARLAGKVEQMAEQKNLEGAAYAYQNLTATCIACHEHLRDTRDVRKGR